MKGRVLSLKMWLGIIFCFIVFQYLSTLFFEEKIFYPNSLETFSDSQFYRLEQDFNKSNLDVRKVAVLGSSRVGKGIECPDKARQILLKAGKPPIQLNKIWKSFDPFELFVEHKEFIKNLIPVQPDLICIQADMLAIQMPISSLQEMDIEKNYKDIWNLEYEGNKKQYISKKIKYQSKVNQELVHSYVVGNPFFQENRPCSIFDVYTKIDTLNLNNSQRNVKTIESIRYAFDDLEMLKKAGIKVVIINTPLPDQKEKLLRTSGFNADLQEIKNQLKERFDIDYWEYSGSPLYFKHYADGAHLNPEGRSIYTKWLLDKILKEVPKQ